MQHNTLDAVVVLVEQLTPEEQAVLAEILRAKARPRQTHTLLKFPVDDLGPWPQDLSLRREDWYEDGIR
jgi:hypothetical protein